MDEREEDELSDLRRRVERLEQTIAALGLESPCATCGEPSPSD